ncbi:MAG: CDP-archaeol synthase [Desulfobacteraceae bacterium]|nr:CDP-archaeol synthase [Desulfobacteraceae bacterium]
MSEIAQLAWFLSPVILGGVSNMIWVKLPLVRHFNGPMDGGRCFTDGKPLLGAHKTWLGFGGMILLTAMWMTLFVYITCRLNVADVLQLVDYRRWIWPWEAMGYGALWGFGYVLFELPNSFVKRRLTIAPGKSGGGFTGLLFTFIDQADSVVGCLIFMLFFFKPSLNQVVILFIMGTGIHYIVNILLYLVGLKKQAG